MDRRAYSQENRSQRANSAAKTVVISPKAEAEAPQPTGIKGLFEGLSVSQVTAGALAAVTSMLLSAQIGIAGSVIGVAVGSVVSTVSSQLYKKFLAGSAEKLRGLASSDNAEENATASAVVTQGAAQSALQGATQNFAHAQTTVMPISRAPFEGAETTTLPSVGAATRAFSGAAAPSANSAETTVLSAGHIVGADARDSQAAQGAQSNTPRINSAAGHTGNASHATGVVEIEAQKQKTMQRRVLAVSVASSLAAILLFAGLVLMFTGGEGIGTKVAPFTGEVVTSQLANENSAATSGNAEKPNGDKNADTTTQDKSEKNSPSQSAQQNSTQNASGSSSTTESGGNSSTMNSGSESSSSASGNNGSSSSSSSSGQGSSDNTNSNSNNANNSGSTSSSGNAANSGSTGSESSASSQSQAESGK